MFVIRKKLAATDITPGNLRWNVDCDCVQQTFDGGDTWVDSPGQDPRSSDAFRAPPLSTDDPRCDAAANMLAKLHAAVDMAIAFDSSVRLAGELFTLFALAMPGLGTIIAIFTIIADVLLAVGAAVIEAAFTDDVYADLLCVFYDHIDADGQMSDSQLADIYTQIASDFDLTVQAVFGAVSSAAGAVGWSNAGALGTATGDCIDCHPCFDFDLTATDAGIVPQFFDGAIPSGHWVAGVGWQSNAILVSNGYRGVWLVLSVPEVRVTAVHIEFTISFGVLNNSGDTNNMVCSTDGSAASPTYSANASLSPATSPFELTFTPYTDINTVTFNILCGIINFSSTDPGGEVTVTRIYADCP